MSTNLKGKLAKKTDRLSGFNSSWGHTYCYAEGIIIGVEQIVYLGSIILIFHSNNI